ncbi:unnamed protein product [Ranitomeya imitator]|uniref:Uncharacterized protein n=1 Tax=Ranitomeya imitator TaxID=111125 RepID=A0ABN9KLV2_9NEOB|nr:unnamed protein product [Ranitomeya imitator]
MNPRKQLIVPPWDLNVVLQGLTGPPFEPLSSCSLQNLAYKTVFLVAITSARRVGELQALSIREPYLLVRDDSIVLRLDPSFLPKVVSDFHRSQEIVLPTFCHNPANSEERRFNTLDVRRIVLQYLDQTRAFRIDHNLFVHPSGQNKGKKVAKSTIATWIKKAITEAYLAQNKIPPVGIKAHSTRSTSVSWAERAGTFHDGTNFPPDTYSWTSSGIQKGKETTSICRRGRFLETELTNEQKPACEISHHAYQMRKRRIKRMTYWPLFVLIFYVISPIPHFIATRVSDDSDAASSACRELAYFFTTGIVVSAFGLPIVLARMHVIFWGACGLVLAGNAVIFLTILGFFIVFGRGDDFSWEQW